MTLNHTLYAVLYALSKKLGIIEREGVSTGGTTATLIDTSFAHATKYNDDIFNQGTIFFRTGAISYTSAVITDWSQSAFQWTFATQPAAPSTTTRYSVTLSKFPRWILIQGVNEALSDLPGVMKEYSDASYVTVADQMDYDLPTSIQNTIRKVEVATSKTSPYEYVEHKNWTIINDQLSFEEYSQPDYSDYRIRLTYEEHPNPVSSDADSIPGYIDIDWLAWEAAANILAWKVEQTGGADEHYSAKYNQAIVMAQQYRKRYQQFIPKLPLSAKVSKWSKV